MVFADAIQFMPIVNVFFLSKFAAQLPASWYSDEFLRTTTLLAKKYIATERQGKTRIPNQVKGLTAISTLWSFWMRKTVVGRCEGAGDFYLPSQTQARFAQSSRIQETGRAGYAHSWQPF
ncbi:MAG: hypothetical protein J3Q66DRAFT_401043 [Benniella sp.]|nr:MAG: hypothetical protein J3Q66DRAFT_401043 [Benniella sp.]